MPGWPAAQRRHVLAVACTRRIVERAETIAVTDLLARLQTALAGRYRVESELGRGGMAAVYLATDQKARPSTADARHLLSFREQYPDLSRWGLVLHTGEEVARLAEGVVAAPWWRLI